MGIIEPELQRIFSGQVGAQEAMDRIAPRVQEVLDRTGILTCGVARRWSGSQENGLVPFSCEPRLFGGEHVAANRLRRRETLAGYLYLAPNLVGFLTFMLIPLVGSLILSFSQWNLIQSPVLIGFDNYRQLAQNPVFWQTLKNTAYFTFAGVPLQIALGLFLAVLLNNNTRGIEFFRTAYFLPVVSSTVAVSLIWQWLFDSHTGLINYLLGLVGIDPVPWLVSPRWAMPSVIIVAVWKGIGYNMVIFLAALKGVPGELYRERPYRRGRQLEAVLAHYVSADLAQHVFCHRHLGDQLLSSL